MTGVNLLRTTFLVVDDNRFMRDIVRNMLHAFGARTVVDAIDGADALEKFATHQPDVVILDWVLPVIDGIEVLRFMRNRKDSPNPYVPVIMLSAYGERRQVIAARDAGVTEYLVKPVAPKALYDRVTAVLVKPRDFVQTRGYFGPDRRRFVHPDYPGEDRRTAERSRKSLDGL